MRFISKIISYLKNNERREKNSLQMEQSDVNKKDNSEIINNSVEELWYESSDTLKDQVGDLADELYDLCSIIQSQYSPQNEVSEAKQKVSIKSSFYHNKREFDVCLIYSWCDSYCTLYAPQLVNSLSYIPLYAYELLEIYSQNGTFLKAQNKCREIGTKINEVGGFDTMKVVCEAMIIAINPTAYRQLEKTWDGVGRWQG